MRMFATASIVVASLFALDAAGIAQISQPGAPESQGRRICRYVDETGKLAARRRVCLTMAEWNRVAEEQRKASSHLVNSVDACRGRTEGGQTIMVGVNQGGSGRSFTVGNC